MPEEIAALERITLGSLGINLLKRNILGANGI